MSNAKDLQTSVYQKIKQSMVSNFINIYLSTTNSQYIAVNLGNSQSALKKLRLFCLL